MRKSRVFIIVIACLVLVSPIAIYWFNFKSNDISDVPEDWALFGDYIGGVINSIISLFTLVVTIYIAYELKKFDDNRNDKVIQTTYKPELILEEKTFYLYSSQNEDFPYPVEYCYDNRGDLYTSSNTRINSFGIDLFNIGLGPAKKIEISYHFDIQKALDFITKFTNGAPENDRIALKYEKDKLGFLEFEYIKDNNRTRATQITKNQLGRNHPINHLLTVNLSSEPYLLRLPSFFLEMYAALLYNWLQCDLNIKKSDWSFPPLIISMKYLDIGNKKFIKKFELDFVYTGGIKTLANNQMKIRELNSVTE